MSRQIKIPDEIYEKLKERASQKLCMKVTPFIVFILRDWLDGKQTVLKEKPLSKPKEKKWVRMFFIPHAMKYSGPFSNDEHYEVFKAYHRRVIEDHWNLDPGYADYILNALTGDDEAEARKAAAEWNHLYKENGAPAPKVNLQSFGDLSQYTPKEVKLPI